MRRRPTLLAFFLERHRLTGPGSPLRCVREDSPTRTRHWLGCSLRAWSVAKTNSTGKEAFPVLQSCGRWVVSDRHEWGSGLLRLSVAHAEPDGHAACPATRMPAPQGRTCFSTGYIVGFDGPVGASVHIFPVCDLVCSFGFDLLILLTKTAQASK